MTLLAKKVAIITGASKGIGRELSYRFAREGARVVCAARSADLVKETAAQVQAAGGEAIAVPCDAGAGSTAPLKIGPLDLGWVMAGGRALLNWFALVALVQAVLPEPAPRPYVGLAVTLGVAMNLWFGSRRRRMARSFAAGILARYALTHLLSAWTLTRWH